jgi:hypothetical protein
MTGDELIAEGDAIARRCFALAASGSGDVVGYWGGSRADISDRFPPETTAFSHRRHIVSVDGALLSRIGCFARTHVT